MISTLYLIQFIAFYLWQITSASNKRQAPTGLMGYAFTHKSQTRLIGAFLGLLAIVGFIWLWGVASGFAGFVVGLMAVGCLCVVIEPFQYLRTPGVAVIYVCCVLLERFL
ncbi:hypothetical protein BWI97_20630 [Siphonobacter sp. BAB-5405]|uniref:hypothetical protein n=1 Tax=Siphonobacter sp. BAB-5405 TaxID=1864825 RepID=UPI000C800E44|nr:hypothetical protein [Siphonobacter sp. BAB-5405]PMD92495.1 hypothetical protein BWI97_20630 [Siphonobacter sp. BAB-5405]